MKLVFLTPWPKIEEIIINLATYISFPNLPGIAGDNFRILIDGKIISSDQEVYEKR